MAQLKVLAYLQSFRLSHLPAAEQGRSRRSPSSVLDSPNSLHDKHFSVKARSVESLSSALTD